MKSLQTIVLVTGQNGTQIKLLLVQKYLFLQIWLLFKSNKYLAPIFLCTFAWRCHCHKSGVGRSGHCGNCASQVLCKYVKMLWSYVLTIKRHYTVSRTQTVCYRKNYSGEVKTIGWPAINGRIKNKPYVKGAFMLKRCFYCHGLTRQWSLTWTIVLMMLNTTNCS